MSKMEMSIAVDLSDVIAAGVDVRLRRSASDKPFTAQLTRPEMPGTVALRLSLQRDPYGERFGHIRGYASFDDWAAFQGVIEFFRGLGVKFDASYSGKVASKE